MLLAFGFFSSSAHRRGPTILMQSSKAAEIPEELFQDIVWEACSSKLRDREARHNLSAFAQVCRYWARQARPWLFRYICLRTPDDARRFLEMLQTPALPGLQSISNMAGTLDVAPDLEKDVPWLHLVFMSVDPVLRRLLSTSVYMPPSRGKAWISLHPSLPRSIPGTLMPIEYLHLDGLHFPDGRVLSRLLVSVSRLFRLTMQKLTFDTRPKSGDFRGPRCCLCLLSVTSDDLELCLSLVRPMVTSNAFRLKNDAPGAGIIHEDTLEKLHGLISIFDTSPAFRVTHSTTGGSRCILFGSHVFRLRTSSTDLDANSFRNQVSSVHYRWSRSPDGPRSPRA